jgi:hypothetical protein
VHTIQHKKTGEKIADFRGMPPRCGEGFEFLDDDDRVFVVESVNWSLDSDGYLHATVEVVEAP